MRPQTVDNSEQSLTLTITNDPLRPSISGLFLNDISDHLPIFSLILYTNSTSDKGKYVFSREKNAHNQSAFKDELGKINGAEMPGLNDPSWAYELFVGKYTTIYDKCFPLRKMKAKRFNLRKPWFTKGLAKSIRKKNKLYQSFLNNPNSSNEKAYKLYKNKLTHSLRVAKRLYYEKQIEK